MKYYIATIWYASSRTLDTEGDAGISRTIRRFRAESPADFEAKIRDEHLMDVDAMIEFGPISESKDQIHP